MWVPTRSEAVEMFARQFEARHRSGSIRRARETASTLKANGDHYGQRIWSDVADKIEQLRQTQRVADRRKVETT
jgi:hypothetical protein